MDVRPADPYGEVCRRWTGLSREQRDLQSVRLLGVPVAEARIHVPEPGCHRHYACLVEGALAGDEVAFAWLADSHRPLLLSRGRVLFEKDPGEWGAASVEILYRSLSVSSGTTAGPWLRRQVNQQLCHGMAPLVRRELVRRKAEQATDPVRLVRLEDGGQVGDPHPELTATLATVMARLHPSVRDGFQASAARAPISEVACEHQVSVTALRQRMSRARLWLRPELAAFRPSA
jgi:hypothetical protein